MADGRDTEAFYIQCSGCKLVAGDIRILEGQNRGLKLDKQAILLSSATYNFFTPKVLYSFFHRPNPKFLCLF